MSKPPCLCACCLATVYIMMYYFISPCFLSFCLQVPRDELTDVLLRACVHSWYTWALKPLLFCPLSYSLTCVSPPLISHRFEDLIFCIVHSELPRFYRTTGAHEGDDVYHHTNEDVILSMENKGQQKGDTNLLSNAIFFLDPEQWIPHSVGT